MFSTQLAYLLAQILHGSARAIVRREGTENGLENWRRLSNQVALPERTKATSLLNEILSFEQQPDHVGRDLSDFLVVKDRHEKTTDKPIDR